MPLPQRSSSEYARALVLNLEPSRALRVWWLLLHALLGAAFALVGWPTPFRVLAIVAIVGHFFVRRPAPSPRTVIVTEGGSCAVPEWNTGSRTLGARTLICPFWAGSTLEQVHGHATYCCSPIRFGPTNGGNCERFSIGRVANERRMSRRAAVARLDLS